MTGDVTEAQERALSKALTAGYIMKPGGFCPDNPLPTSEAIETENFDTRQIIDRLIDRGFLTYGDGINQYVLTDAGRAVLSGGAAQTGVSGQLN